VRRRAFNLLAVLSLLLCVAMCALGAWSYWDGRTLWRSYLWASGSVYRDVRWGANCWGGEILLTRIRGRYAPTVGREALFVQDWSRTWPRWLWMRDRRLHDMTLTSPAWRFMGVKYQREPFGTGTSTYIQESLAIPLWLPALSLAVLPAWAAVRSRLLLAAQRMRAGLCPACGYDLRASPDRCPECGTARGK
jgi:hypothetical protein